MPPAQMLLYMYPLQAKYVCYIPTRHFYAKWTTPILPSPRGGVMCRQPLITTNAFITSKKTRHFY